MSTRPPWSLLAVVLLALGAGLLALTLLWGGIGTVALRLDDPSDGRPEARGDTGTSLEGPAMALDGTAAARPHAPGSAGASEDATPVAATFPASEGVAGRVLTAGRDPIAGAKVTLHVVPQAAPWGAPDPPSIAETVTAKDGSFLVGPAPAGRLRVRAIAKGYAPSALPVPRRGVHVELTLDVGGSLRVKAVTSGGLAVDGASALYQTGLWGAMLVSEAVTGADGTALFESVPTGTGGLLVTKTGLGAARRGEIGIAPGRATAVVLVLQGGRELGGMVTNALDKRPVSGAAVEVHYPWLPGLKPGAAALTDDEGRYRTTVDVSVGEQFELRVARPGFADLRQWLNYNDGGAGAMTHDLVLDQAVPGFGGRVRAADGGAVVGAEVSYGGQQPGQTFPSATSGAEGRFDLSAPAWGGPGSQWWIVALHAREGVGSAHAALPQRNAARGTEIEITLSGAGRVTGSVKDASGAPVAGAAITLQPDWNALDRRGSGGARNMDWLVYQLLNDARVASRLGAVSDADGRFAIESVPTATYQATAQYGALQGAHEGPLEVRSGQEATASIALGDGQGIEGQVLDPESRPIPGATIWSQPQNPRGGMASAQTNARSQSDGRFRLPSVGPGAHQVFAQAAGFAQAQLPGVQAGARDAVLRMKALGWIDGQLLLDERPYAGTFHVTGRGSMEPVGAKESTGRMDDAEHTQTFNDAEGRFTLQGLPGGEYRLTASTGDGLIMVEDVAVRVVEGAGAGPVSLHVARGASIVGEVEGTDARPIVGAWIWASPSGAEGRGPAAGARSDKAGTFRLSGLGAGTYRLGVNTEQGSGWTEQVDVVLGAEQRVRLRERLPGRVSFTVLGSDEAPLAKARPTLHDDSGVEIQANWQQLRRDGLIDGRTQESWERATTTDVAGRLTRHHVPPGRYRAGALLEGHVSDRDEPWIEVASGAVTEVTVVLRRTP